jgi:Holliday junction resolvase RusA-like endonuclease
MQQLIPGLDPRVVVSFDVRGTPITKGSKSILKLRDGMSILVEQTDMKTKTMPSGRLTRWMKAVAASARIAMTARKPFAGHCELWAEFIVPRPQSHYLPTGALAKGAFAFPNKPDNDKLLRAIKDAMSGVVYGDDAQVAAYGRVFKRYAARGGIGGARIMVAPYYGEKVPHFLDNLTDQPNVDP